MKSSRLPGILGCVLLLCGWVRAYDVTSYRYGSSAGMNSQENSLTLDSADGWDFGLMCQVPGTGRLDAAPLVKVIPPVPGKVAGKTLVIVANEQNVLRAFDVTHVADRGFAANAWTLALTNAGGPVPSFVTGASNSGPWTGITTTPVLDTNGILYVLTKSIKTVNTLPVFNYSLYRINATNGTLLTWTNFAETMVSGSAHISRTNGAVLDPYVWGNGDGSVSMQVQVPSGKTVKTVTQQRIYFDASTQRSGSAMTMANGVLYAAFDRDGTNTPSHGWVLGFNSTNLSLVAALNTTPCGALGGCGLSGGAPATDPAGNLYLQTGPGSFGGGNLTIAGFPANACYGNCFLKLAPDSSTPAAQNPNGWGLRVADYFSPMQKGSGTGSPMDLGTSTPLLIMSATNSQLPSLLAGISATGTLYSMNAANMGKFNAFADACLQSVPQAVCSQNGATNSCVFGPLSYAKGRLFVFGGGDYGKQFLISPNGVISSFGPGLQPPYLTRTDVQTTGSNAISGPLGCSCSLSSSAGMGTVLWVIDPTLSMLRAFRPSDLLEVWNSSQTILNNPPDSFTGALPLTVPVVANGQVFVGTDGALQIFGLAPATRR
jgi:hypothetical protein